MTERALLVGSEIGGLRGITRDLRIVSSLRTERGISFRHLVEAV